MLGSSLALRKVKIAVASGKGGTGKTLVATNLAVAAARSGTPVALVDCDVEAPNDALFLRGEKRGSADVTFLLAEVDAEACTGCGACRQECAYGAIRILGGKAVVFEELCHGCGRCTRACPVDAIREVATRVGEVEWGSIAGGVAAPTVIDVVTGRLDVGQVKSPDVIRAARKRAAVFARSVTVLDAPPGVSCSAVAAMRDADALVLVTEPTPFGLHDLAFAVRLGRDLDTPMGIVVNRAGSGRADVGAFAAKQRVPVLLEIPFDRRVAEIYARGGLVIDEHPDGATWFATLLDGVAALAGKAEE
ncbi:minD superfamily P-loop ATPase containing an inserted ferredoxin domain [Coriobacteriaceae bacterium EMTCatB1]|nr:minD superfamily P-loop ATPase containing an inserted ferredoxin domain [Coriobacteriaceae bacterium EMTCatB1]